MSQLTLEQSSHTSPSASTHLQMFCSGSHLSSATNSYPYIVFQLLLSKLSVSSQLGATIEGLDIMPSSPSLPIPLLPVILIPLHLLYHQHPDSSSSTHHMQQQSSLSSYYYPSCCLTGLKKSKYVIGLVDQAVKSLYTIYGIPQDILNAFTMSSCTTVIGVPSHKQFLPLTPYQPTGNKPIS